MTTAAAWRACKRTAPPNIWTTSPQPGDQYNGYTLYHDGNRDTFQLLLQDQDFAYDSVDNPIEIRDWRLNEEWPDGSRPVSRKLQYDDLYRLTQLDYEYKGGTDAWKDPFASEDAPTDPNHLLDPRRAQPSPHVQFDDSRPEQQMFSYDWLGNTSTTGDDVGGFYDRSLGTLTNGTVSSGPYQLRSASNHGATGSTRTGDLVAGYYVAGNLTGLIVKRTGTCLPTGASCSTRFAYDWDEVGRLSHARRWDLSAAEMTSNGSLGSAPPTRDPDVDLRHAYDASDQRVIKTATVGVAQVHTVYIFASLELHRARYGMQGELDYEQTPLTEVPYLTTHGARLARTAYEQPAFPLPRVDQGPLHVVLELGDHLGSTSLAIDQRTSELVEASTYLPFGATETDYRPARWDAFREDYRFTGKEEDIEVGLRYFGKRYYAPSLNRWVSADPLVVHVPAEADLNVYAYVHGQLLKAVDPVGLQSTIADTVKWHEQQQAEQVAQQKADEAVQPKAPEGWDPAMRPKTSA